MGNSTAPRAPLPLPKTPLGFVCGAGRHKSRAALWEAHGQWMHLHCCHCHPHHCWEASGTNLEWMQTFDSQHCLSRLAKYFGLFSVSYAAGADLGREEAFWFWGEAPSRDGWGRRGSPQDAHPCPSDCVSRWQSLLRIRMSHSIKWTLCFSLSDLQTDAWLQQMRQQRYFSWRNNLWY